jgi:hypothetical protein
LTALGLLAGVGDDVRHTGLEYAVRRAVQIASLIIVFAFASVNADAQAPDAPPQALAQLIEVACETGTRLSGDIDLDTGYVAMLGVGERSFSFQVLRSGVRAMMIPADRCAAPRALAAKPAFFILSHSFQNRQNVREGYYYLMDQRGQLINAVHFQQGRSHRFAFAAIVPLRRADFEAEKSMWISKVSARFITP